MKTNATYANMMHSAAPAMGAFFTAACALYIVMMGAISLASIILFIVIILVFLVSRPLPASKVSA